MLMNVTKWLVFETISGNFTANFVTGEIGRRHSLAPQPRATSLHFGESGHFMDIPIEDTVDL
jgi:hypothetical protein